MAKCFMERMIIVLNIVQVNHLGTTSDGKKGPRKGFPPAHFILSRALNGTFHHTDRYSASESSRYD